MTDIKRAIFKVKLSYKSNYNFNMQEDKNAIFQMRFPHKLWYLLNMHTDAILWGGTGRTILLNYRVLHNYLQCENSIFKTTNISSFVRQLNLYGFRKVTSHLQDPLCNSSNPYMHEYIHDFFQYGRPELINKITRKAITLKRNSKSKNIFTCSDQSTFITPLEKARRALRIALKKTAQDIFIQTSPQELSTPPHDFEDAQDDICEEEDIAVDWLMQNNVNIEEQKNQNITDKIKEDAYINTGNVFQSYGQKTKDCLMNFADDTCHQNVESFPTQFLNMPDLDPEPSERSGAELLGEFNIQNEQDFEGKDVKQHDHQFLNCVLPSISRDQADDVSMTENHKENTNHYHSDWDQMFNDIITSKGSSQECSSNLKELYTQISQTIHL